MLGYSGLSAAYSILAAAVADKPDAPMTTINGDFVDITWTVPYNGGTAITGYKVLIQHNDGSFK